MKTFFGVIAIFFCLTACHGQTSKSTRENQAAKLYEATDNYTSERVTYSAVSTYQNGKPMNDSYCDDVIYRKVGNVYYKRNFTGPVNVKWFGAKGDGITDDSKAIIKAVSKYKNIEFDEGSYLITQSIDIPGDCNILFNEVTISGHLDNKDENNNWLFRLKYPGNQIFKGKVSFTDNSSNIHSESDLTTRGLKLGDAEAIHSFNSNGCDIRFIKLKQACYIGGLSYTNSLGSLFIDRCGTLNEFAFVIDNLTNNISGANNIVINSLRLESQITGNGETATSAFRGKGAWIKALGVTINNLHVETIANTDALVMETGGYTINGGYAEFHGKKEWNTLTFNGSGNVNGMLINCAIHIKKRTVFNGCKFLLNPATMRGTFIACSFPNANQFVEDIDEALIDNLPQLGTSSSNIKLGKLGGNFSGLPSNYPFTDFDVDFYKGNHSTIIVNEKFLLPKSLKFIKAGDGGYSGAIGFALPENLINQRVNIWAIVKVPAGQLAPVKIGVGGLVGSGKFDVNSISTVPNDGKWKLILMPDVLVKEPFFYMEPNDGGKAGDYCLLNAFGCERGGISFAELSATREYNKKGNQTFDADGAKKQFAFPHGFNAKPATISVNATNKSAAAMPFFITSDDKNIYINYNSAPPKGQLSFVYTVTL